MSRVRELVPAVAGSRPGVVQSRQAAVVERDGACQARAFRLDPVEPHPQPEDPGQRGQQPPAGVSGAPDDADAQHGGDAQYCQPEHPGGVVPPLGCRMRRSARGASVFVDAAGIQTGRLGRRHPPILAGANDARAPKRYDPARIRSDGGYNFYGIRC